jgi:hypothetical protein
LALYPSGWPDGALARLPGTEDLWIGALGSLLGAALGIAAAPTFASSLPTG